MQFAKKSLDFPNFDFFKHSFWCKNKLLKRVSDLLIFMIRDNKIILSVIYDPLFFPFLNHARDPLYDPQY